jgi:hypothetical protein
MIKNSVLRVFGKEYFNFLTNKDEDDIYLVGRIDALKDMIDAVGLDVEASEIITKASLLVKQKYSYQTTKEMFENWLYTNYGG